MVESFRGVGRAVAVTAAVSLVVGGLAACAAPAPPKPPATVFVTVTPTPTPAPAAPAPAVTQDPPAPAQPPVPNDAAPQVVEGPATDEGARAGASGTAVSDANGQMISYTVVSGDSFFDIAQRFDLPQQQLLRMNPQIHDFGDTVYIGTVINLDWTKTG
ncbi:MAG: LysM domain-containing protein [Leifsonia sp.]